jgi:hypothetical protein
MKYKNILIKIIKSLSILFFLINISGCSSGRESKKIIKEGPSFPRIANCYGAGVGIGSSEAELDEVARFDLLVGGFKDFNKSDTAQVKKFQQILKYLKTKNPNIVCLDFSASIPYTSPSDKSFPPDGWLLTADGKQINGWPGAIMINLLKPQVRNYLVNKANESISVGFDGSFIDCFGAYFDVWACEIATGKPYTVDANEDGKPDDIKQLDTAYIRVKKLLAGEVRKKIGPNELFMANQAFFCYDEVNGVLFEDYLDPILDPEKPLSPGVLDREWTSVLNSYLKAVKETVQPTLVTLVSSSGVEPPFNIQSLPEEEKKPFYDKGKSLTKRMRFGLTTALLGNGYYAYDLHTRDRGQHWWYPEYDAPLGYPVSDGVEHPDGTWWREFEGGISVCNPNKSDVKIRLPKSCKNVSDNNVKGRDFVIPAEDGYVFVF